MRTMAGVVVTISVVLLGGMLGLEALFSDAGLYRGFAWVIAQVAIVHLVAGAVLAALGRSRSWALAAAWGAMLWGLYALILGDTRVWLSGLLLAPVAALAGHWSVGRLRPHRVEEI